MVFLRCEMLFLRCFGYGLAGDLGQKSWICDFGDGFLWLVVFHGCLSLMLVEDEG